MHPTKNATGPPYPSTRRAVPTVPSRDDAQLQADLRYVADRLFRPRPPGEGRRCDGHDRDPNVDFHPETTPTGAVIMTAAALAAVRLCGRCPLRELCREWADLTREKHGTLGGETEDMRQRRWRAAQEHRRCGRASELAASGLAATSGSTVAEAVAS